MCNHDCFNCTYDDCIVDGVSEDEKLLQDMRDSKCKVEYAMTRQQRYFARHPDKLEERKLYMKQYRKEYVSKMTDEQKERRKIKQKEYARKRYLRIKSDKNLYQEELLRKKIEYRKRKGLPVGGDDL